MDFSFIVLPIIHNYYYNIVLKPPDWKTHMNCKIIAQIVCSKHA